MANYIDKDKLFIYLASMRFESNIDKGEVLSAISKLPTANVAPRAEVAREIVEFLFGRSRALQHTFKDNPDSAQCFRGRFELENAATIIANDYGVDLKKKYESEGADDEK